MIYPFNTQFSFPWYKINWIKNINLNETMYENINIYKNLNDIDDFVYEDDNPKVKFSYINDLWNI